MQTFNDDSMGNVIEINATLFDLTVLIVLSYF